ncbi:MAG: tRNA delta(2)-isopentenylpyrophosphate transferase [Clostridiales bacterium 38_11]|nr:MAG: tRNA delta(2)-isopentenylpyrophosphate transferase [Clostridiales bacterium 38_11]HBH11795.1 tRNA (adenosine(37)-N6)-dimethylallyltransferase MiaA [Clostridiales bacterium]
MKKKLVMIVGPTAVGKTRVSVETAKLLDTEVISADAMQIYIGMNIGTAKIREDEKQGIPHHMIDLVYPDEKFTVSDFKTQSGAIIEQLHLNDKIPVIAGGTGLYINSLIYKLNFSNTISDDRVRSELNQLLETKGKVTLHRMLESIDPIAAGKIHVNNAKRVMRALEVYHITGRPFSASNTDFRDESDDYHFVLIGLEMDRQLLYNRIDQRVDDMVSNGLIDEVMVLRAQGYGRNLTSMQGIGYKEIMQYLDHEITLEESVRIMKRNTRRLAKRQFTWFKADNRIKWIHVDPINIDQTLKDVQNYLSERGIL